MLTQTESLAHSALRLLPAGQVPLKWPLSICPPSITLSLPTPHGMLSSSGAGLASRKQLDNMGVGQREGTFHFSYEETKARDIQQCAQVAERVSGRAGFDPSSA